MSQSDLNLSLSSDSSAAHPLLNLRMTRYQMASASSGNTAKHSAAVALAESTAAPAYTGEPMNSTANSTPRPTNTAVKASALRRVVFHSVTYDSIQPFKLPRRREMRQNITSSTRGKKDTTQKKMLSDAQATYTRACEETTHR